MKFFAKIANEFEVCNMHDANYLNAAKIMVDYS